MDNKALLKRFVELAPKEWGEIEWSALDDGSEWLSMAKDTMMIDLACDRDSAEAAFFLWDYLEGQGWMPSISSTEDGPTLEMVTTGEANEFEYVTWNLGYSTNRIEALVCACVAYWESTGNQEGE